MIRTSGILVAAVAAAAVSLGGPAAADEYNLRLSHIGTEDSDVHDAAMRFVDKVRERSDGRIDIRVYPANQLGDWTEVHDHVMQGAVDMAIQSLSTSYDERLAISWFPYLVATYDEAREAYSRGGFVDAIVDDLIAEQDLKLLGVYGAGMGGAACAAEVPEPRDPDAERNLRIRVWPGGETHRVMMERLGFSVTTVPWAELYTAMQTGVVDCQIGGTPELAVQYFEDITQTWIQYNDHYEPLWIFMNMNLFDGMSSEDRQIVVDAAQDITNDRFDTVQESDQQYLEALREVGAEVVILSDEELAHFAEVVRSEVWPEIEEEVGPEIMAEIYNAIGSDN